MCFFCFNVPPSGQNVQRLFKFLLFEFSMRRKVGHQNLILLFSIPSGANSFVCRVKFASRKVIKSNQMNLFWKMATTIQWRQISSREDVFRNRRAPSPTSWRFPSPNLKISCTRRLWSDRTARGPFFTPVHSPAYKSKFLFVFVCFVSLVFFWSSQDN